MPDQMSNRPSHRRRTWTFEKLEDRHYLSATALTGIDGLEDVQWYAVSNSTPEGQQLISALEQQWAAQATASTGVSGATHAAPYAAPTDPFFTHQWHLFNVGQVVNPGQIPQELFGVPGQDINVIPAWDQGYSGAGVVVAVVDTGVQLNHPDLVANLDLAAGYDARSDRSGGGPAENDPHGTAVAGLIAAAANNGIGGVGGAFGATLVPIRFLGSDIPIGNPFINAIEANGAPIDVYNHSWGPNFAFFGRAVAGPTMDELIALTDSAVNGRGGLGAVHIFAAGNSAEGLHSAGSNGYVNSRYTIGVGIVDHDGQVPNSDGTSTNYGELAPSVLVVAPSASGPTDIVSNFATGSGLFTTDLEPGGYNIPPFGGVDLDIDTFPDTFYTTRFGGTSGATPLVSLAVALMLEANPNLSYRDVQEILVRSARQNDDIDESWITNLVPLFRDPIPHNAAPPNYPNAMGMPPMVMGPYYPSDENQWNDEIVYQLLPATVATPAVQAATQPTPITGGVTFSVHALAGQDWDGWVGNNLSVTFRTLPDDPFDVVAQIIEGQIRVTVSGTGATWGDIEAAVELLGQDPFNPNPMDAWFDLIFANAADVTTLFDPADEAIVAPLMGGIDATGTDSVLLVNPQYLGYHPIADPLTNPEPDSLFTNGAGYTVSHGRGGNSEYGWAHGVVNVALAVELAKQWHLKDQNLPPEKTYLVGGFGGITIRAAEITNEESGEYVIPGALSNASDGFAEYFNEFFVEPSFTDGDPMAMPPTVDMVDPDSLPFNGDDPPANTRGTFLLIDVPAIDPVTGASNLMSTEWVEVQLNITGSADAFNYLRVTLVSPDGTHSELTQNQYMPENVNNNFQQMATGGVLTGFGDSITPIDENGSNTDTFNWVYSTNRHWGERSDTNPVFDEYGNLVDVATWELHFENYSGSDLFLQSANIAFHGSPIGSPAGSVERIMGKVGVDSGRFVDSLDLIVGANDGEFNFDRSVTQLSGNSAAITTTSSPFNLSTTPFGSHEVLVADTLPVQGDPLQERFAENITVYAIDNTNGERVAEFVTGYDGNFYFDLPENTVQATTGVVVAENTTFTVAARRQGIFKGAAGNNIQVSPHLDPTVTGVLAVYDGINQIIDVFVEDETVTWGDIEAEIESLFGGGQFTVTVGNRLATFAAADQNIVATLTGGDDGGYTIRVEDPLGRTALADGRNGSYDDEWVVLINTDDAYTRTAGEIDPVTGKLRYFNDLNFLLDPGSVAEDEVVYTGQVIGDLNGNGIQDPEDIGVFNFRVYADLNHTSQFEIGEPTTFTDLDGNYELTIPTATPNTFSIGVKAPTGWTVTVPASGFYHDYSLPGEQTDGIDFAFTPPTTPSGEGNGTIFGFVFNDRNGDGVQQAFEVGLPDMTVFIDANLDGELDENNEIFTKTSESGAYQFGEVVLGDVRLDVVINEPFVLTAPPAGYRDLTLIAGQVSIDNDFGVQNLAINDFGDLVGDGYLTYGPDAASHFVAGLWLGPTIDAEIRPRNLMVDPNSPDPDNPDYIPDPNLHGIGDDQEINEASFDDEDGVVILSGGGVLRPGNNTLLVTVNGVGGYLQAWFDVNNNGTFDAGEQFLTDEDLNPGAHQLLVVLPETLTEGEIAARFRWGTIGLDFFGPDIIGEVEDYVFNTELEQVVLPPGDFNGDQVVDNLDYELWVATWGSTQDLRADGNGNGVVDAADYSIWRDHLGQVVGSGAAALVEEDNEDAISAAEPLAGVAQVSAFGSGPAQNSSTTELTVVYVSGIESPGAVAATVTQPTGSAPQSTSSVASRQSGSPAPIASFAPSVQPDIFRPTMELTAAPDASLISAEFVEPTSSNLRQSAPQNSFAGGMTRRLESDSSSDEGSAAAARLRLLDRVLAERVDTREDDDSEMAAAVRARDEQQSDDDELALVSVFDEEIDWRFGR